MAVILDFNFSYSFDAVGSWTGKLVAFSNGIGPFFFVSSTRSLQFQCVYISEIDKAIRAL